MAKKGGEAAEEGGSAPPVPGPAEKASTSAPPAPAAPTPEAAVEDLPRAIVRRLVKEKLSDLGGEDEGEISVNKDALAAFAESARIFIHYLSATANDICKESKRQTINADDVLKALDEIEFPEFVEPLRASLDEFRKKNAGKREAEKKRKAEKDLSESQTKADSQEENLVETS